MALKKYFPDVRMGGNKVDPDEINYKIHHNIIYPSIATAGFGTAKGTGNVTVALGLTNTLADYPRNVVWIVTGVAGGEGGTVTVTGTDQFGVAQTETIGFASANAGNTAAGTRIFATVTGATATLVGLGGTAIGSVSLGYASGTAAGNVALFGLPVRIGALTDVKRITWINNGTVTAINGGTIQGTAYVGTANHTFNGSAIVAATDIYQVSILSTYNGENQPNMA